MQAMFNYFEGNLILKFPDFNVPNCCPNNLYNSLKTYLLLVKGTLLKTQS